MTFVENDNGNPKGTVYPKNENSFTFTPFTHPNLLFLPTLCDFLSSQKEIIVIIHFHYIE